jgi:hypothetical protein
MTRPAHATESHSPRENELDRVKTHDGASRGFSLRMLSYTTAIPFLFILLLVLAPNAWAQNRAPILEQIAKTYGLDSFGQVDAIRYTWTAQFPGVNISRTWTWEPKTNKVTFEGKDKEGKPVKVSYVRTDLASQPESVKKEVDPGFINDNYWLLFPFHAKWDTSATVTDQGMKKLPIGSGTAKLVSVKYPNDSGYTPGDTWDLYVGKNNRVEQFAYHRGGATKPSLVIATWAGYKKAGPLLVSTEHRGTADGKPLHIFISDLSVKLAGSDKWIKAQ